MSRKRWNFPDLGIGIGLRTVHFAHILSHWPQIDWFEVLSENYMDTQGRPAWILDQVAERYPVALHGVSLGIGNTDPLNLDYLRKLKGLADRTRARWVSDHLCWTGILGRNTHDLLPMPYTEEALKHTIARTRQVSEILGRPLVLENPSSYVEFAASTLSEWEFLKALAEEADCGLLLDVNNVYVSSFNHGFDPRTYIDAIPAERVVQYHVAGHTNKGTHIVDTHSDHAVEPVWQLYRRAWSRTGPTATLYEWDENIPEFDVVHAEARKALTFRDAAETLSVAPGTHGA
jgi:uncharacterized protein (UPF0276 family)